MMHPHRMLHTLCRGVHPIIGALIAITLVGSVQFSPGQAEDMREITEPEVKERIALMRRAHDYMNLLGNMAAGRVMFDKSQAKSTRKALIRFTKDLPKHFKNDPGDPVSNARPLIWSHWDGFEAQADAAKQSARAISTRNLGRLRQSLQPMMQACLSCHTRYRKPP